MKPKRKSRPGIGLRLAWVVPFALAAGLARAQVEESKDDVVLKPVSIQYDKSELITVGDKRKLLLTGNVMATQGELAIRADRVEAIFSTTPGSIASVVATGGVTVNSGETVGRADRAEFDNAARTVELSGIPMVVDQGVVLKADRIVLHVDESRVVCERCSIELDPTRLQAGEILRGVETIRGGDGE